MPAAFSATTPTAPDWWPTSSATCAARLPANASCWWGPAARHAGGSGRCSTSKAPRLFTADPRAYDMMYGRDPPFLAFARAHGAATADGLGMLVEQAAEAFHLWGGVGTD